MQMPFSTIKISFPPKFLICLWGQYSYLWLDVSRFCWTRYSSPSSDFSYIIEIQISISRSIDVTIYSGGFFLEPEFFSSTKVSDLLLNYGSVTLESKSSGHTYYFQFSVISWRPYFSAHLILMPSEKTKKKIKVIRFCS